MDIYAMSISGNIPVTLPRNGISHNQKWMNQDTVRARHLKIIKWARYRRNKTPDNYRIFTSYRNQSVDINREAKKAYEMNLADDIEQGNIKAFYSYMRSQTTIKEFVNRVRKPNGELTINLKETAETMNSTFHSVFIREEEGPIPSPNFSFQGELLVDIEFTVNDVAELLGKLKEVSSPGPDGVHPRYLRETAEILSKPIYELFRESLDSGCIPVDWKMAHVIPIYKKGNKNEVLNYRPVSLTAIICKVMEKIVVKAMVVHLTENNLFSKHQHGFRSNRSCLTQLLEYFLEIHERLDDQAVDGVDAIYLDCRKAFDTVPHRRLIAKLEAYGISGKILRWIKNLLTDRKQRVSIKGVLSDPLPVVSGVPQGSVIGPLLFLIYINDLLDGINSDGKLFADDAKIFRAIKDIGDREILQADLSKLQDWSSKWLLKFNEEKCKVMHISLRNTNPRFDYTLNNINLEETTIEKDLGIYVSEDWKSSAHTARVANKANSVLGRIRRTFTFMNKTIFMKVYPSMVRSHLEYAVQAWSPRLRKDIVLLEKVQRRATKMVPECRDMDYDQRLMFLGLSSLEDRRRRGDLIQVFKIMHGFDDLSREMFFKLESEVHGHHTRGHNLKIATKYARTSTRASFFDLRVINEWNALPQRVVSCRSISAFKAALDRL